MAFAGFRSPLRGLAALLAITAIVVPAATSFQPGDVAASTPPTVAGCPTLPDTNVWNARVDQLPVHPSSNAYLNNIGLTTGLKADFGSGIWNGAPIGIPYVTVPGTQPRVPVSFDYWDESDPGSYPIPPNPPIEGGPSSTGDRHILMVDKDQCVLYELYSAYPNADGSWHAGSGAIYPLNSNALRPAGWTSADAAGLPILPGLARYDEIATGEISHALRFTASVTQRAYLWPARHFASSNTDTSYPPMGMRVRLKANYDISGFSSTNQKILRALKSYGMILADNGSNWFISGVPDSGWDDTDLRALHNVLGSAFEVVDEWALMMNLDSGEARPFAPAGTPTLTTTPTRTATQPPSATRTPTVTPAASSTAVPSATATNTAVPTATVTRTPTSSATPSATAAPATNTPTPTPTPTPRKGKRH
jgi:hypothetical protein